MASLNQQQPAIFGIYGLPGAGKSYLLKSLQQMPGSANFMFFEGSEIIAKLVTGGLEAFKQLPEDRKLQVREAAISHIAADCIAERKAGIVTGHYMFWSQTDNQGTSICTQRDLDTYTHIIYLNTPAEVVAQRCREDLARSRYISSVEHLRRWQHVEKVDLRKACYHNGILFLALGSWSTDQACVSSLLQHFRLYSEKKNIDRAEKKLDEAIKAQCQQVKSMLVMDCDKTMAAEDTGDVFWNCIRNPHGPQSEPGPLKLLFNSSMGYTHTAFRQANLLYGECADVHLFEAVCSEVAAQITLYPEIVSLLRLAVGEKHAGAIVITCGVRLIWQMVLEREGLSDKVKVIGGGHRLGGIVVDAAVKAALVTRMRQHHGLYVTAFGDSTLDLPMLSKANQGIVVVGDEQSRSKSMDDALAEWISKKGLRLRQALLARGTKPRLSYDKLPLAELTDASFADDIFPHRYALQVIHLTDTNAAKLLMTPMRDAIKSGPSLRDAHHKTGWYLANNALVDIVGTEDYLMQHVQGNQTTGYRLTDEQKTLIVALMRGGESMAFGINDAFPLASFLHAKQPQDVTAQHMEDKTTIILMDSVVNSGQTMIDFVHHLHNTAPAVRIVMVTGVVQDKAVGKLQEFQKTIRHQAISLVALRKSENVYTGKGSTDTGNRLFNTVQLD